jgi:hypothetical protein
MTGDVQSAAAESSAAGRAGRAVYVYGLIPSGEMQGSVASKGVGDPQQPVRVIEGVGVSALVSDVKAGWTAARREDVEAHERLLSRVVERTTVVPMRFGVVMDTDEQVRTVLLERHAEQVQALLRRVEGRVQMTLKAFYPEEALLREVLKANPRLKRQSDALKGRPIERTERQRIALGREVAEAIEAQRAMDERTLVEPLAPIVADLLVEQGVSDRLALSAQLLVDRARRDELDEAVRRLSTEHGKRFAFRYVGPLAPYSFTSLSLDATEEQWD